MLFDFFENETAAFDFLLLKIKEKSDERLEKMNTVDENGNVIKKGGESENCSSNN